MLFHESWVSVVAWQVTYLLRKEVFDTRETQDLGKLTGIAKRVGKPCLATAHPKLLLEVALAVEVMTTKTLSRRQYTIVLQPSTPDWVESPGLDLLLDGGEERRVQLLEPGVLLSGRRSEVMFGITSYEIDLT
jgi:hypothetical protein